MPVYLNTQRWIITFKFIYLFSASLHLTVTGLLLQLHGWQRPSKFSWKGFKVASHVLFLKFVFNWRIITLQCYFCHTTMRISHNYTHIYIYIYISPLSSASLSHFSSHPSRGHRALNGAPVLPSSSRLAICFTMERVGQIGKVIID